MTDDDLEQDRRIARLLRLTWSPFFQRFGRLTPVQRAAIPVVARGGDALLMAATASGKTEAACAPLIERIQGLQGKGTILYISPTRALVNDLYERLRGPLAQLNLKLARRTGDHHDALGADVILTTPESFDSLLCRGRTPRAGGHALANVAAVVLDEVHLLYGTARGEQVRWLLERLRRLRRQAREDGWSRSEQVQVVAVSATVSDANAVRAAYLSEGTIIDVPGGRTIETAPIDAEESRVEVALRKYIGDLDCAEKILVFANSRLRVDDLVADLRDDLEDRSFICRAHHGSLDVKERESTERALRESPRIVVVATSTLELGIDIGDIDLVVLDGPAPDMSSLLQRVGRGNRRTGQTRVMLCASSPLEATTQSAMIQAARERWTGISSAGPQFAVARQQVASYVFQAPERTRSRSLIEGLMRACLPGQDMSGLLRKMVADAELHEEPSGLRLGELWLDRARRGEVHSNIESPPGFDVVDEESGHRIAGGLRHQSGEGLKAGGTSLEAAGWKAGRLEVRRLPKGLEAPGQWSYATRPRPGGADQQAALRRYLGLDGRYWPVVQASSQQYVFHLGGQHVAVVLRLISAHNRRMSEVKINSWYIRLPRSPALKPAWVNEAPPAQLDELLAASIDSFEREIGRPAANKALPDELRLIELRSWLRVADVVEAVVSSEWTLMADPDIRELLWEVVEAHEQ